jgi:hypothetical protein
MRQINVSIDMGDQRAFEEEHFLWSKTLPRAPGSIGHMAPPIVMAGPTPDRRCNYIAVPEPFLEVLKAKGFPFQEIP